MKHRLALTSLNRIAIRGSLCIAIMVVVASKWFSGYGAKDFLVHKIWPVELTLGVDWLIRKSLDIKTTKVSEGAPQDTFGHVGNLDQTSPNASELAFPKSGKHWRFELQSNEGTVAEAWRIC